MNRREKILAGAVGLLVLLFLLNVGFNRLVGAFTSRMTTVADLESDVQKKETMIHRGKVAQRLLQTYKERSLPSDKELAGSRYRAWLHDWVGKAGVNASVKATQVIPYKQMHDRHGFSVVGDVTLPQLVDMLFQFYSSNYLHRIKSLSAKPVDGKFLSIIIAIEAISLPDAEKDKEMKDLPAHRLMFDDLAAYKKGIVSRNPYAPANQPPKIVSSDATGGYVDQPVSFAVKAEDPEKTSVRFRLEGENPDGVKIDEESGRLTFTSSSKGEFEVNVVAFDDGIPSKEAAQTIRINIGDPPPPEAPQPVRRSFDEAKYTYVTGIVEVNGRRQVWLTVRSEGKWLRLFEGETFEVGDFEGKIVKIHLRHVEIESQDETRSVRYGESISEGQVVSKDPSVAASN